MYGGRIGSVLDLGFVDRSGSIPMDWTGVGSMCGGAFFGTLGGDVVGGTLFVVYSPGGVAMLSTIGGGAFLGDLIIGGPILAKVSKSIATSGGCGLGG